MATTGDRDREQGSDAFVDLRAAPARPLAPARTVYDDVRQVLLDHGWTRGRERNGRGELGIVGAIETVVHGAADGTGGAPDGTGLARAARVARHLRELAGTSSLAAWNDAAGRTLDDVVELLTLAAVAYPED